MNVLAAKNMENNCRNELTKNRKYADFYNKLYDHKIKSAQKGTTVIANYIHAFYGYNRLVYFFLLKKNIFFFE